MSPDTVIHLGQQAMTVIVQLSAPMLLASLLVGLVVAIFQAATQINEATLTFVPKLLVIALIILLAGPWMLQSIISYTQNLIRSIPGLIG
ncbi:MAG: hypothetical protein RIQ52_1330 [Pseudomonadota bacterium]|jgi:flagellar biosynthetic protein FliQ